MFIAALFLITKYWKQIQMFFNDEIVNILQPKTARTHL